MSDCQFPILDKTDKVPWEFVAPHEQQARRNHNQTLKRLAQRGGLSWSELELVLLGQEWDGRSFHLPRERDLYIASEAAARGRVKKLLDDWRAGDRTEHASPDGE